MSTRKESELKYQLQLKDIEIIRCSFKSPSNVQKSDLNFDFNLNIECKADSINKLIYVLVHVKILNEEDSEDLGNVSVSCVFEINNFIEVVQMDEKGIIQIPQELVETLSIISVSTTRGIMFGVFKGTHLHHAILPLINPEQLQTH